MISYILNEYTNIITKIVLQKIYIIIYIKKISICNDKLYSNII